MTYPVLMMPRILTAMLTYFNFKWLVKNINDAEQKRLTHNFKEYIHVKLIALPYCSPV